MRTVHTIQKDVLILKAVLISRMVILKNYIGSDLGGDLMTTLTTLSTAKAGKLETAYILQQEIIPKPLRI